MHCNSKFLMQYSTTPGFKSQVSKSFHANIYQTNQLPPSGGPILSATAKKEPGKKDAAKGGGRAGRKRPAPSICFANAFLIERERGSKTAPFTLSLPGARLGCVRHRRRTLYRLPNKLAPASVP